MAGALRPNGPIICFGCWRTWSFESKNELSSTQISIRDSDIYDRKISVVLMRSRAICRPRSTLSNALRPLRHYLAAADVSAAVYILGSVGGASGLTRAGR